MNLMPHNLPVNWFDVLVVIVLVAGAMRGRKRGMSQEMIPLLKWITLAVVCGMFYRPVAQYMADTTVLSLLTTSFIAYLGMAMILASVFALLSRRLGGKIIGSDTFGTAEYYLGILAGMFRYACILVFALSLLNARLYTQKEIDSMNQFQQQNFDNNFFPTFYTIQHQVFEDSFSGPVIHNSLGAILIRPTIAQSKGLQRKQFDLPM